MTALTVTCLHPFDGNGTTSPSIVTPSTVSETLFPVPVRSTSTSKVTPRNFLVALNPRQFFGTTGAICKPLYEVRMPRIHCVIAK